MTRKDITGEEKNKLSKEEVNACAPPDPDFDKFVCAKEEKEEDMDDDDEGAGAGSEEVEVDGEMGKARLLVEIEECKKGIQRWFTKEVRPDPFNPRVRNLFEHLDMKKIKEVLTRKDITREEMNKLLEEEVNACSPPYLDFDKEEEEEDMDEDEDDEGVGSEEVEVDGEMGKRLLLEIEECKKGIQRWFTEEVRPDPFNPRLRNLFEHLDMKKIKEIMTHKDITREEMNKLLEEEVNRCAPPYPEFNKFVRADNKKEDNMDEDDGRDEVEAEGEMGKMLCDQGKPGIVKRPQLSLVQSELECKKPRIAEGLGFQGVEPVAAET